MTNCHDALAKQAVYGELLLKQLQVTDKGHGNGISSGNCQGRQSV
jgi:hypothetical protein